VVSGRDLDRRPNPEHVPARESGGTVAGRWVDARDLREGDVVLLRSGKQAEIRGVTRRFERTTVYNFEVEEDHTYAVGDGGVLVHNRRKSRFTKVEIKGAVHKHHTIPREIRAPRSGKKGLLPKHLVDDPDIVGRPGNPNRWDVPAGEHIDIHKRNRPGGDYNKRWKDELERLRIQKPDEADWTKGDILGIRDRLATEFKIDKYRP
jgi:hypothetical protein